MKTFIVYAFLLLIISSCNGKGNTLKTISLEGVWKVAETLDTLPTKEFFNNIQVPGLIDMKSINYFKSSRYIILHYGSYFSVGFYIILFASRRVDYF